MKLKTTDEIFQCEKEMGSMFCPEHIDYIAMLEQSQDDNPPCCIHCGAKLLDLEQAKEQGMIQFVAKVKRAIKINAKEKRLHVVQWDDLSDLQRHVGGLIQSVPARLGQYALLVDEEGMLKDLRYGFVASRFPDFLYGNGLIVGDDGVDFCSTDLKLEDVEKAVGNIAFVL